MAMFFGQACPLCGVKMVDGDQLFATSHFLGPEGDLWQFSDTVMQWDCYARWEHRARFGRLYFEAKRDWSENNSYWGVAHTDDQVFVTVNPNPLVAEVDVMLAETGGAFRIPLADWEDCLERDWFDNCRHEIEREALANVLPLLKSKLPTADAVIAAAS